ncbi:hypothetical protein B0H10DRAFT_1938191 [Mycena sp. CBHHK59/15]|nr:hypothetical protein B0H10DRAFT_1938191 [Mycena sp. CBHHK59/15]
MTTWRSSRLSIFLPQHEREENAWKERWLQRRAYVGKVQDANSSDLTEGNVRQRKSSLKGATISMWMIVDQLNHKFEENVWGEMTHHGEGVSEVRGKHIDVLESFQLAPGQTRARECCCGSREADIRQSRCNREDLDRAASTVGYISVDDKLFQQGKVSFAEEIEAREGKSILKKANCHRLECWASNAAQNDPAGQALGHPPSPGAEP